MHADPRHPACIALQTDRMAREISHGTKDNFNPVPSRCMLKIQTNFVLAEPRMGSFPDSARNFDYHSGTGARRRRQDVTTKGDKRPRTISRAGEKRSHLICRQAEGCSTLNACKTGPFPMKIAPFSFPCKFCLSFSQASDSYRVLRAQDEGTRALTLLLKRALSDYGGHVGF